MILYHQWVQLPFETRAKIAKFFGIEKKGATEVFSNTVKSDGYLIKDVEDALGLHQLQKFLGTEETDFRVLWEQLIAKVDGRIVSTVKDVVNPEVVEPPKKKRGRPKGSKNKHVQNPTSK